MNALPKNILIISLKYLGDVIAATPALRALRETFPAAHIAIALRAGYEEALLGNPNVNEIVPIDVERHGVRDELRTIFLFRKKHFDTAIALEPGDRESWWAFLSGARRRIAPAAQSFGFLWNVRVPVVEGAINFIDYYCALAQAAGARVRSRQTEMFVSPDTAQWAERFIASHDLAGAPLIGIHPGAREASRRWGLEKFAALIDMLAARGGIRLIIMAGCGESDLLEGITRRCSAHVATSPELSIQQTAALMARCAVCVTNDSAPRHIAAAVGTRTVAAIPAVNVRPWTLYDPRLHATLPGNDKNPQALVENVGVQEMFSTVEKMLGASGG